MHYPIAERTFTSDAAGQPINIKSCARCGEDHENLTVVGFDEPIIDQDGTWQWWLTCPTTGDPILMQALPIDVPAGLTLQEYRAWKAAQ